MALDPIDPELQPRKPFPSPEALALTGLTPEDLDPMAEKDFMETPPEGEVANAPVAGEPGIPQERPPQSRGVQVAGKPFFTKPIPKTVLEKAAQETAALAAGGKIVVRVRDKAIGISAEDLDNPEAFRRLLGKVAEVRAQKPETMARGITSKEDLRQLADAVGLTTDDLLTRGIGEAYNAEHILGMIDLGGAVLEDLKAANVAFRAGALPAEEFMAKFDLAERVAAQFFGVRKEAGIATATFAGETAQATVRGAAKVSAIGELRSRGLLEDPQRISDLLASLPDPQKVTFIRQIAEHGMDFVLKAYYNALLGPTSVMANVFGNTMVTTIAPFERMLAGGVGAVRSMLPGAEADRVFASEGVAMIQGMFQSFGEAMLAGFQATRTGVTKFGKAKEIPITLAEREASGFIGRGMELLSMVLPTHLMMGTDEAFKVLNYRAELWAQAKREGLLQGLGGKNLNKYVEKFVRDPDPRVDKIARQYANYATFTQDLTGRLGAAQDALSHPFARVFVPFFRTPINIFRYNLERYPVLGMAVKQTRADILAGGARADLALGKMALGGMSLGFAAYLVTGGMITGRGPSDPILRRQLEETGWKPYAIRFGDKYFQYDRLDTYGNLFAAVADFTEISGELSADDANAYAVALQVAFTNNFLSKTYMEGLSKLLKTVMSQRPEEADNDNWLRSFIKNLVPATVAQINQRTGTPWSDRDQMVRETFSLLDEAAKRFPGTSETMAPRRNLLADPVWVRNGIPPALALFLPTTYGQEIKTPEADFFRELGRLRFPIEPMAKVLFGPEDRVGEPSPGQQLPGIPLNAEQFDTLQRLAGQELKLVPAKAFNQAFQIDAGTGMLNMKDTLLALVKSPVYKKQSDTTKVNIIRGVVQGFRQAARVALMDRFKELGAAYAQLTMNRAQRLMPAGESVPFDLTENPLTLPDFLRVE